MKPLGVEPDAAMRGGIVHQALHEFAVLFPDRLPDDIEANLVGLADAHFAKLNGSPLVEAFWRPNFQRFARWFAATEPKRRHGVSKTLSEVAGSLDLNGFILTARADRIDVAEDGTLAIYDYKTGAPPIQKRVDELHSPQLPLEALMAEQGGFGTVGKAPVSRLVYVRASARDEGGEESDASNFAPAVIAAKAREELLALIETYSKLDTAYAVKRRPGPGFVKAYDYDEYEHLARVKEWLTEEAEEDFG
jgi:ATP-dependent helicase/nuclease subunit B